MVRVAFSLLIACLCVGCSIKEQKTPLVVKTELEKDLKEISGITAVGSEIWAITDKPKAAIYRLDSTGKKIEEVHINNQEAEDVEAVAADRDNLYIGDVGDNKGDRVERRIVKVALGKIPAGAKADVEGELIEFTFPGETEAASKKQNNFDCESLLSFRDSLYVFTKDRQDNETRLYSLPKLAGKYVARLIDSFDCHGLVTDAAVNAQNNELALIGYHKGHLYPFIYLFDNFRGNDFFSGKSKKINLAAKPWDWQLEGITYSDKNVVYMACEGTKEVQATLYGIKRDDIFALDKKKQRQVDETGGPGMTKKGHLKM